MRSFCKTAFVAASTIARNSVAPSTCTSLAMSTTAPEVGIKYPELVRVPKNNKISSERCLQSINSANNIFVSLSYQVVFDLDACLWDQVGENNLLTVASSAVKYSQFHYIFLIFFLVCLHTSSTRKCTRWVPCRVAP